MSQQPGAQPIPPPPISIGGDLLSREEIVDIEVQLPADAPRVWLLASTTGTASGPCQGGVCAAVDSPEILGPVATDATGIARFSYDVPDVPLVWLQVMARRRGQTFASAAIPTATVAEDCTNNLDDDGDGLLDCEDGACMADPACGEADCADGGDDDNDGLVDCMDDDCWGRGCAGVASRILGGQYEMEGLNSSGSSVTGGHVWQRYQRSLQLTHVTGSARMVTTQGGSTQCTWSAAAIDIDASTYIASSWNSYPMIGAVRAQGLVTQPGCTIATGALLPRDGVWDRYGGLLHVPEVGEAGNPYSWFSSYGRNLVGGWVVPQSTYQTSSTRFIEASPRTYSYGSGSTYMFYNFRGSTRDALQTGTLAPGDEAVRVLP